MKNLSAFLVLLLAASFVCAQPAVPSKYKQYKKSSSGLLYKYHHNASGENCKPEQIIVADMKIELTAKDSVLRNSFVEAERLQMYVLPSTYNASLEEAFLMLSPGDSASFLINADSMWAKSIKQPLPPFIPAKSYLHFTVKLYRTFSKESFNAYQDSLSQVRKQKEISEIEKVLASNNLQGTKTASGLYYVVKTPGTGAQPQAGQTVTVHYAGYLLNGTKFDASTDRGQPFEFQLGQGMVIKGWDEGIAMMKVGEKGMLFIPSDLGYGPRGAGGSIPPNSILIFEVELLGIK